MTPELKYWLVPWLLVACMGPVRAEDANPATVDILQQRKREETQDVQDRLQRGQRPVKYYDPIKLESEKTHTIRMETKPPEHGARKCQAEISLSYLQFDTQARVDTTIENYDCAASSGQYNIRFKVVDQNGATGEIEYDETWILDDGSPHESRKFYEIGDNVELTRAITRVISCTCSAGETE